MENTLFIKELLGLSKNYKAEYIKGILLSMMLGGINILLPMTMLNIFDNGVEANSIELIIINGITFVALTLLSVLCSYKYTMKILFLENRMAYETRCRLMDKILKMPASFFNNIDNGELFTLLYGDVEKIPSFLTNTLLSLIKDTLTLCGLIWFLSELQLDLLIILLAYQIVIVVIQNKFKTKIESENIKYRDSIIEKNKISQEYILNLFSAICAKLADRMNKMLRTREQKSIKCNCDLVSLNLKNTLIISFVNALMIATILCYGGIKVVEGQLSIGALVTFNIFSQKFITPIMSIYRFPTDILDYKLSWSKIKEKIASADMLIDQDEEIDVINEISFKDVIFKYNDVIILNKCNFQIKKGNMYALVGCSGSGKSTIVKLMLRLWDRFQGDIYINNKEIRQINIDSLRSKISYISQDLFLMNGTLRDNLQSEELESDECLIDVIYKVNLGEWFENLSNGLDTNLGDNGCRMSGGEKQRIVIARTILQSPQVLILDEATSMLDEITEKSIFDLIKMEFNNCIIMVITHRLKSLNLVDSIVVLNKGVIAEEGTYKELLNNRESLFGKMFANGVGLNENYN
ncbi:MAG: ABC transporter ATP-binding protein [Clostridia bacterium]|nr:ABC transporter ATP-binding protein [Clostridia bacterium]